MTAGPDRVRLPTALWRAVARLGIPPAALLRQARLPATLHLGGVGQVTTAHYLALLAALEALVGDPALGLRMVEATATSAHPPASLAAFHARDYRDALARLARFKRLCTPELLTIDEAGDTATVAVAWPHADGPVPAIAIDIAFATLVELGGAARGGGSRRAGSSWRGAIRAARSMPAGSAAPCAGARRATGCCSTAPTSTAPFQATIPSCWRC